LKPVLKSVIAAAAAAQRTTTDSVIATGCSAQKIR
jgi:hypothetical protein